MRRLATLLAVILPAAAVPSPADQPPANPTEITVQVLEDAWRVGDEKTYTLLFDRAPFGRHALSLIELRDLPDGGREAIFRQRITLDLRALGQEGMLQQTGTLVYRRGTTGPYRYQEVVAAEGGYETYRGQGTFREGIAVELDPGSRSYDVSTLSGQEKQEAPLPEATGAMVLDLLALGQWERVFSQQRRWPLGETVEVPLLLPTAPPRFDYHLPVTGPRPVEPQEVTALITVEALEEVALFGARAQAFRCRVEPLGLTLWVSPLGGILRFDDGHGLTGALEP